MNPESGSAGANFMRRRKKACSQASVRRCIGAIQAGGDYRSICHASASR